MPSLSLYTVGGRVYVTTPGPPAEAGATMEPTKGGPLLRAKGAPLLPPTEPPRARSPPVPPKLWSSYDSTTGPGPVGSPTVFPTVFSNPTAASPSPTASLLAPSRFAFAACSPMRMPFGTFSFFLEGVSFGGDGDAEVSGTGSCDEEISGLLACAGVGAVGTKGLPSGCTRRSARCSVSSDTETCRKFTPEFPRAKPGVSYPAFAKPAICAVCVAAEAPIKDSIFSPKHPPRLALEAAAFAFAACCFRKPLMLFFSSFIPPRLRRAANRPSRTSRSPAGDELIRGETESKGPPPSAPSSVASKTVGTRSRVGNKVDPDAAPMPFPLPFPSSNTPGKSVCFFTPPALAIPTELLSYTTCLLPLLNIGVARNAMASMDMPPTRSSRCSPRFVSRVNPCVFALPFRAPCFPALANTVPAMSSWNPGWKVDGLLPPALRDVRAVGDRGLFRFACPFLSSEDGGTSTTTDSSFWGGKGV
mmetsp:Transcript_2408/g.9310  ORF Transcript_2408/g.9310 Transcript_2408/m.9310 type:complete len:474 (+) Transcript_2408:3403-4824(+)